jgi:hypothetical protein
MRGGYREYQASHLPPWVRSESPSKSSVLQFLESAQKGCEDARLALYREYSDKFKEKLFGGAKNSERGLSRPSHNPEAKVAERLALKMLSNDRRFTMAITGQSNAAGHGSYFDETYTFAMARASAGAFKASGIDLAVQNFAVGGGRTLPTTGWCGEKQVGSSVDVAVWDFTMTEGGKSEVQGEAWVRSMMTLPQPPAALVFMEGHRASRWAGIYKSMVAIMGFDNPSKGLDTMNNSTDLPPPLRFLHPDCKSYAAKHGDEANVLCRKDKWSPALDLMQWKPNNKGTLQPAVYDASGKRVAGGCPGMNPWHDGWKLHKLKGSIMAHVMIRSLSQAIEMIKTKVVGANDVSTALDDLRSTLSMVPREALPKPGRDCLDTPYCSLIGKLGCASALRPSVYHSMAATDERGQSIENTLDNTNEAKRRDEASCHQGHIDHKFSVMITPEHGWASIPLIGGLNEKSPAIIVCEPPTGWNRDARIAELSQSSEVQWRLTSDSGDVALSNPVSIGMTKACYEFKNIPHKLLGGNNLKLQLKALTSKTVRVDHFIWHREQ